MLFERMTNEEQRIVDILRDMAINDDCEGDFFKGKVVDNKNWLYFWEAGKRELSRAFGHKLILRKLVSVVVEDDELHSRMSVVQSSEEFGIMREIILNRLRESNPSFDRHIWGSEGLKLNYHLGYYLFNTDVLVSNRYTNETIELRLPDGNLFKLAKGCKAMKAMGRLAKACGCEREFETVRLKQSQVLNEARLNSTLCLSIHPLDYMTASYNNNGWHSCMNWEDGEFRRGVIEMMNSTMVVCAYLESKHEKLNFPNNLEWNSKKWREFFIVSPEMISGIKGYPYWNRHLEQETLKWLYELYAPLYAETGIKFSDKIKKFSVGDVFDMPEIGVESARLIIECGPAMYNDFYDDNEYFAFFSDEFAKHNHSSFCIDYSGASECIVCGGVDVYFDGEGELVCRDCAEHHYCCCCGDQIRYEEDLYVLDGQDYCRYCFERLPSCSFCDTIIDPNNQECTGEYVIYIPTKHDEGPKNYNVLTDENDTITLFHVCANCAEKLFVDGVDEVGRYHDWICYNGVYYACVNWNSLTELGKQQFNPDDVKRAIERRDEYMEKAEHTEEEAKVMNF